MDYHDNVISVIAQACESVSSIYVVVGKGEAVGGCESLNLHTTLQTGVHISHPVLRTQLRVYSDPISTQSTPNSLSNDHST